MSITGKQSLLERISNQYKQNRWLSSLLAVWVGLIIGFAYPAQANAASLVNGGMVSGAISSPGEKDTYTFTANAGEYIQLRVADINDTSLVPAIQLYAPDGTWISSGSGYTVAEISHALTQTGTYTVVVFDGHSSNPVNTGAYNLYFIHAPGANEGGTLINGGVISGTIDLGDLDSYTFTANAGEYVQLRVADINDTSLIPAIRLYAPDGTWINSGSGYTVAEISHALTQTGTYTVVVFDGHSSHPANTGAYNLYFIHAPGANEGGTLINGGVISGTIDLGDLDSYTFTANAGEYIQLRVADINDTSLIPAIRLYAPDGTWINSGSGYTVAEISHALTQTGTYTVVVFDGHSSHPANTGAYNLYFVHAPGANEGGTLISGGTVTDTIDLGDLDSYTFTANAGDNIHLQVTDINNTSLIPAIRLYAPDGTWINSGSGYTVAAISHALTQTGTYTVVVFDGHSSHPDNVGGYTLTLNCTNSSGTPACSSSATVNPQKYPFGCGTSIGNPIDFSLGFKYQIETDYASGLLAFKRYYRSDANWYAHSVGQRWRHNYNRTVKVSGNRAHVTNEDGLVHIFENDGSGNWAPIATDHDVTATLVSTSSGYLYTTPDNTREIYNTSGKLIRIEMRGGKSLDLAYDGANRLVQVSDESGRSLSFAYNGSDTRVLSVTTPDGVFSYSYGLNGNLITVTKPDALIRTYHYENTGFVNALTGITDEKGVRFATYGYDAQGRAISSEHAGGVENYTVSYNADGSVTATNPLGKQTTYHFETILGVRKVVSVEGHQSANCAAANKAYTYDARGFLQSSTDWLGNLTTYIRDERGLVTSMTEAAGSSAQRTATYTYDPVYRLPAVIAESGKETRYDYDAHGRVIEKTVTDPGTGQNRTTAYAYHPDSTDGNGNTVLGRLASIDGARTDVSDITSFAYDASYNLSKITNALGHETSVLGYDSSGRPTLIKDSNGVNTSMTYDAMGRLISTIQGATAKTSYAYDERGLLKKVTLPNGAFLNYGYDNAGRLIEISNSNSKIVYTLDNAGNRIAEVYKDSANALKYQHNRVFDELSRLKQSIDANNHTVQYGYDVNSNITQVTDGNFNSMASAFDALDRLTGSVDALNGQTTGSINDLDQTTGITDPRNNTTHYSYNAFGDLIGETSPDRGTTAYTVDAAGNILKRIDARGMVANFQYDALNRLTRISYPSDSSLNTTFVYDKPSGCGSSKGRLCSVTNASGTSSYVYNQYGDITRVTEKRGNLNFVTRYTYDAAGVPARITLPSGRVVTYGLNANKQISKVSATVNGAAQTLASSITYLPFGDIKGLTYGNGLRLTNSYNKAYQLTARKTGSLMNESYSYDAAGNITVKGTASYGYDALYRLSHENSTAGLYDYDYDAIGNRLTGNENGSSRSYNYPPDSSKLSAIDTAAISYDAAGNIIADAERSYVIDAAGRVQDVSVSGTVTGSYGYDVNNLRIRKTTGGNTTHYVYGLNGLLHGEYDASGNLIREYVYLNGEPLAQVNAGETVVYLHTDHLGTPRIASDSSAAKIWEWKSDAFGNGIPAGTASVNIRFPGQYYDDESGLHYNWNRYYDPRTGRYITSDPIGLAGGINTYAYVSVNPMMSVDPEGLRVLSCMVNPFLCSFNITKEKTTKEITKFIEEQINRNRGNLCSPSPPQTNMCYGFGEGDWEEDNIHTSSLYHCGNRGYRTFRNPAHGWQCTYDPNGRLDDSSQCMGTFDRVSPTTFISTGKHLVVDVFPHSVVNTFKSYTPHLTKINDRERKMTIPGNLWNQENFLNSNN